MANAVGPTLPICKHHNMSLQTVDYAEFNWNDDDIYATMDAYNMTYSNSLNKITFCDMTCDINSPKVSVENILNHAPMLIILLTVNHISKPHSET